MKIPLSWLQDFIEPDCSPAQIANLLTSAGLEVDSVDSTLPKFERIIVGRVVKVEKHPNAEKLCVASVTDGIDTFQVVCGAPNCREGLKTAFAPIGATLLEESGKTFTITKAKLRGVESFGMLCSSKELQIGEDSDGIIEFSEHVKEGSDISQMYGDTLFEISLTPNLNHCASVLGVARELSALTGQALKTPLISVEESKHQKIQQAIQITVEDKKSCPRYSCRVIKNVKVAPSPDWLQKRLVAAGFRPVNNIVDITNYVLMEFGQPLHAFDYDTLEGQSVIVRSAKGNEKFITLDGKERILETGDLLICDKVKPVTLAGIMGGLNSEVSDKTTNILIESAYFHSSTIRKTSKRLGLQTDSSRRFERGSDPNGVLKALDKAAMMIHSIANGEIVEGIIDIKDGAFPEKIINCRLSRVNKILGTHLSISEIENVFQSLKFQNKWDGQNEFSVTIPTYRVDISAEIDLIEEVARIYGYNNIRKSTAKYQASTIPHTPIFLFEREIRTLLVAEGLQEFITCDLIGPTLSEIVKEHLMHEDAIVRVLHPTSVEQSILRTSTLPGLLQLIKYNIDHQNHNISGFEVGRIHFKQGEHYKEESVVGIVLSGKEHPHHWERKPQDVNFFDTKGIIENLLLDFSIDKAIFKKSEYKIFHTGRQASIFVGDLELGSVGEIHPTVLRRLGVSQRIIFAELSLHALMAVRKKISKMQPLPIYPSSERDWTLTARESTSIQEILTTIQAADSRLLEDVSLVDIYRSEKLGNDLKNITLRFTYRDKEKTIEQDSVENEHKRITSNVLQEVGQNK